MAITWIDDPALESFAAKRVFCRVDFNVPLKANGEIIDDSRIKAALPTLHYLLQQNARVIVASHLGRPDGKKNAKYSLHTVAERLQALLEKDVVIADNCVGPGVNRFIENMSPGSIVVLENLRFNSGEENNDSSFCRKLAQNIDIYVNEAFSASHRAHASVSGVALQSPLKFGGISLRAEIAALEKVLYSKEKLVVVLGGAKVSDKLGVITQLMKRARIIIIGGAMAYTFLKAQGVNIGKSRFEENRLAAARQILQSAKSMGVEIVLPVDHVVCSEFKENGNFRVINAGEFSPEEIGVDIGPRSAELFSAKIGTLGTLFWNGPMGVSEWSACAKGTQAIIDAVKNFAGYSVVGGGDSVAAVEKFKGQDHFSYISMGGGAGLEFLEGAKMPGLSAIGYDRVRGSSL